MGTLQKGNTGKGKHCKMGTEEKGKCVQIFKCANSEKGTNMNIVKRIHCKWEHCKKGTQEKGNTAWEMGKRGKGKMHLDQ